MMYKIEVLNGNYKLPPKKYMCRHTCTQTHTIPLDYVFSNKIKLGNLKAWRLKKYISTSKALKSLYNSTMPNRAFSKLVEPQNSLFI